MLIFLAFLLATHSSVAAFSVVPVAPFGIVKTSHNNHRHRQALTSRQTCRVGMVSVESTSTAEAFSAEFQQKQQLLEQALKRPGQTLAVALEFHQHPDPDLDPTAGTSDSSNMKIKKVTTRGDVVSHSSYS
jgi:hypothetical protein